jgi:hypothetical protein
VEAGSRRKSGISSRIRATIPSTTVSSSASMSATSLPTASGMWLTLPAKVNCGWVRRREFQPLALPIVDFSTV